MTIGVTTTHQLDFGNGTINSMMVLWNNACSSANGLNAGGTFVIMEYCELQFSWVGLITGNIFQCVNILFTCLTNVTLIAVILLSPNLRTPPNNHLINICANNLMLGCCMVVSVAATNVRHVPERVHALLAGFQIFIATNSFLQYWNTFTAISYYRLRTVKKPSLSTKIRRDIVRKTITGSWVMSVFLSLIYTLSTTNDCANPMRTVAPFRHKFYSSPEDKLPPDVGTIIIACFMLLAFLVDLFFIVNCYYRIFAVLDVTRSFRKTRVTPWHHSSITSESTEVTVPSRGVYKPMENNWIRPFTVSENFIVHYQKRENSLDFQDVIALENPIFAASMQNRIRKQTSLKPTLSNCSCSSTKSKTTPDFTDISKGADLERFQKIKNNSALRKQFLKRDRISLSSATKNSLVMLCAFIACSMPLFICSCPGVLSHLSPNDRLIALAICRFIFYLNGPIYPTWYLFFSRRVKKCFTRVIENLVLKCRGRRP